MEAANRFVAIFKEATGSDYAPAGKNYDDFGLIDKVESKAENSLPYRMYEPSVYGAGNIKLSFRVKVVIKCKNSKRFRSVVSAVMNKTKAEHKWVKIHADMNGHIM